MPAPSAEIQLLLPAAWTGMSLGVVAGAALGLFFHRDDWMGGYNSFRRRMARLGHIAFFGLAFVNLGFALTLHLTGASGRPAAEAGVWSILIGQAAMPAVCFLSAWRKPFRHLFFIPVLAVSICVACALSLTLFHWNSGHSP